MTGANNYDRTEMYHQKGSTFRVLAKPHINWKNLKNSHNRSKEDYQNKNFYKLEKTETLPNPSSSFL